MAHNRLPQVIPFPDDQEILVGLNELLIKFNPGVFVGLATLKEKVPKLFSSKNIKNYAHKIKK